MIKYSLICSVGHEFEGWFQSSAAFDTQARKKLVTCLICGSTAVTKAVMAPRINSMASSGVAPADVAQRMRDLRDKVVANSEYVGPQFAEEARRIHYEEAEARGIYGEATLSDALDLNEEGIAVMPLPRMPEDHN
jgi:hypothetical protein